MLWTDSNWQGRISEEFIGEINVGHTVLKIYPNFILMVYQYFHPSWFESKKPNFIYSSISRLVLKQEFRKSWPNCPQSYTNDIKANPA